MYQSNSHAAIVSAGHEGSFSGQFGAALVKNFNQKKRNKVQCCLELLLPVFFVAGLILIWLATSRTTFASKQFVSYNGSTLTNYTPFRSRTCNNGTTPVDGLPSCPQNSSMKLYCHTAQFIPILGPFCTINVPPQIVSLPFISALQNTMVAIPTLDDLILLQWAVRSNPRRGGISRSDYSGLQNSGLLYFVPNSSATLSLVQYINASSNLFKYVYGGVTTEAAAEAIMTSAAAENKNWGIIRVDEMSSTASRYEIRLNRSGLPQTDRAVLQFYSGGMPQSGASMYISSGFLTLQNTIDTYYATQVQGLASPPTPVFAPMGFPGYTDQAFLQLAGGFAPLILVLAFLYPVSQLTKNIVLEKELRIREAMMIMGLGTGSFYMSWIVTYAIQYFFSSILITIILVHSFVPKSSPVVVFFIFFLFGLSSIALSGVLAVFFSKSRIAALVSPVIYFVLSVPLFAIDDVSRSVNIFLLILSPSAFATGLDVLFSHEQANGLGNAQLNDPRDKVNMIIVFFFLVFDIIVYLLLMLYLDTIMPNDWGTPRHPCFCCLDPLKWFWSRRTKREDEEMQRDGRNLQGVFEAEEPAATPPTVSLCGLRKEFTRNNDTFVAVNNMQWSLREGQISVLLGHNGAGKTTTMNLMTGMLEADSGDCYVYGKSVRNNLRAARQEIGLCPQHNVLWPDLTCAEHLHFYAAVKGLTGSERDAAVDEMLHSVDLFDKRDDLSDALSGGQKRKLSVAIAFVGRSRLIFLDEPTAGMDVAARRHTWDLIKRMAVGRTILLTTHFMDEADLLGHTIAIMSKGRLMCTGSSIFLKSKLGVGYSLTMSLEAHAHALAIFASVERFVPKAELTSSTAGELAVKLPMDSVSQFPELLSMLETSGKSAGVRGFGISVTTLEEIFLKIARDGDGVDENQSFLNLGATCDKERPDDDAKMLDDEQQTTRSIWGVQVIDNELAMNFTQLKVLLVKRLRNSMRDRRTQCLQIFVPVICVLLAMLLTLLNFSVAPALQLTPAVYGSNTILPVDSCASMFNLSISLGSRVETFVRSDATGQELSEWLVASARAQSKERYSAMFCNDSNLTHIMAQEASLLLVNYTSFHEYGISLNTYHSAYLKARKGEAVTTVVVNRPLPLTGREEALFNGIRTVIIGIIIMIPFTFIPSTFVGWIVKERQCKARHLQNVSGVRFSIYWLSNLLFDIISFFVSEFLVIIIFLIFNRLEYIGDARTFAALFLLFFFYGLSGIAVSYAVSFLFEEHSTAQNIVMLSNFIAGFLLVMVVYILSVIDSTKELGEALRWIFRLVPSYCLGEGIINLASLSIFNAFTGKQDPLQMKTTGYGILYMALEFPFFFLLTLIIDHPDRRTTSQQLNHNSDINPDIVDKEDPDVAQERKEIEEGTVRGDDLVIVKHLRKVYPSGKVAVRNISFGVHAGEVFGFLGTNGAGKTTAISILCQEFMPTNGRAFIVGHDVVEDSQRALRNIGYCPQFDALLDLLTTEEHLSLYAGVRGVVESERQQVVDTLLNVCELKEHRATLAMNLSGGNRRKLSVALSLVGGPRVVFLDEPSAGMDPVARRGLWKAIQAISSNCSVVLTTHHLEEVEALAHRVAIMVDGVIKCIGSKTHLKAKFGSGFEMSIRLAGKEWAPNLEAFMAQCLPEAKLNETRSNKYNFALPQSTLLSNTFALLERYKKDLNITDYNISQTSLEQVFLRISEGNIGQHSEDSCLISLPVASPLMRRE